MPRAPVVVHPPCSGGRRVTLHGQDIGRARRRGDIAAFLRRAGFPAADLIWEDARVCEWREGGPDIWFTR